MYEILGSQFFRTTTGTQSGPNAFDESRFVMTFLTILGVIKILCSFKLVLEGKTSKEIPKSSRLVLRTKFLRRDRLFCFISICKFSSFKNPFPLITKNLKKLHGPFLWMEFICLKARATSRRQFTFSQLNFNLDSEDLFCWDKQKKNDFYELWQEHKQLKTIEMSEA